MGLVLKGRDPDLGRDVALKVLREDMQGNADMIRRFVEEAQIGGQLQHPGIVPIYELGTFTDKRPYFAMKLVKGDTLAKLLEARKSPADGLPRFLAIFGAIAQTVAYSHARGVIHRDLKPSNVMVGSFGEVQVMDWGLAKVLPRGGVVDDASAGKVTRGETVIATARSGSEGSDISHAGSVLGTPSYMAPEQARGEIDQVDERADVFALGSILCEILTSEPAFVGRSSGEIQRTAGLGDLADALARLDACGADPDLVALTRDCLAREREDRPRSAGELTERVAAYLAGVQEKLTRSERERAVAQAQSVEERKQRRLQVGLAAAVLALMTVGGGGYLWNEEQKAARVAKTNRVVDEALADVSRLWGEAKAAPAGEMDRWGEVFSAAKRAEGLLAQGEANAMLANRVSGLLAQLERERAAAAEKSARIAIDRALLVDLESIRDKRADDGDVKRTDADYAAAFQKAGLDLDKTEPAESGKWLGARSEPVVLAGYLDDWSSVRKLAGRTEAEWRRLVTAARAADPDPWRDALRSRVGASGTDAAVEFRRLADDEKGFDAQPAASLILLARQLKTVAGDRERAANVLRRAVFHYPGDYWARVELSYVHGYAPPSDQPAWREEATGNMAAAVAIRPLSAIAHNNFGVRLFHLRKYDQAVAEYGEAIRLKPDLVVAHINLAHALEVQGKLDLAAAECRDAIRLKPDNASANKRLVDIVRKQGKVDQLVAEFREAVTLRPDDVSARYNLAHGMENLGRLDEAVAAYRELVLLKPSDSAAFLKLGEALKQKGDLDEAVAAYREAIRLKPDSAAAYSDLGNALTAQKKYDDATAAHREAIRISPNYWSAHNNLAVTLQRQGKLEQAAAEFREAIRLAPDFPLPHNNLGNVLKDLGNLDGAIAEYREAIRLHPEFTPARWNLVDVLRYQGKLDHAIVEYREAIRLQPDDAYAHFSLAMALERHGKLDQAIAAYRDALRFEPDNVDIVRRFRMAVQLRGQPDAETNELRVQMELARKKFGASAPQTALALAHLGANLVRQGKWSEAEPVLRECLAIREKTQPDAWTTFNIRSTLGATLLGQGKCSDAEPMILSGYEGMKAREAKIAAGSEKRLAEASERIVPLYEAWGKKDKADEWRTRLAKRTPAEKLVFADLYSDRKQFAAAARYCAEALAAEPKLAESRKDQHRYTAACCAALAASGQDKDEPHPSEDARAKLRGQVLESLRAELAAWATTLAAADPKVRNQFLFHVQHWKVDADLACIRDPEPLSKLSDAERKDWTALWADVDALIKRVLEHVP